ncbi:triphosphoribosyl-dephospho-CoA synthase [Priestia abyssalis]|uniref:triphosphoribosyl-dephospho-CoA synthase n=1 Tax=Priestia abyssalis TaxID=1221450 RepID=UPI00099577E5|nr:triphosphoribosyl-dephospho-CoA synthase [Priestia abyssalis]
MVWNNAMECSEHLANLAVTALMEEAELTPKPGLVDKQNTGAHTDLTIELMIRSAQSLRTTFADIAYTAFERKPSQRLREEIAEIGRHGEKIMLTATGGTNTHKGAIWALGLLTASAAIHPPGTAACQIAFTAGELARYPDRYAPKEKSNGTRVQQRYKVSGARGEAQQGFPHVIDIALPALYRARDEGMEESYARLDALAALIAHLDDTCVLHRGGLEALTIAKEKAMKVLAAGGVSTLSGWNAIKELDAELLARNASPGGSADLLAAALFLDYLSKESAIELVSGGYVKSAT